jgi:hypothetical protein
MNLVRALLPWVTLGLALSPAAAAAQQPAEWRAPGVRADSIVPETRDRAASATVTELIRGRAAGLNVMESSGVVGSSPRLWIRGPQSILLRNDPLVVVDGVRVISEPDALGVFIGGQSTSRLEDLSPDEVASVHVLRGPAATALYGPEGASGVLEIRTRGGSRQDGEPRLHAWSSLGLRREPGEFPANFSRPGVLVGSSQPVIGCTVQLEEAGRCTPTDETADSFNPLESNSPFRDGVAHGAGVRVSGSAGDGLLGYALSAGTERAEGVLRNNARDLRHLRGSLSLARGGARLSLTAAHAARDTDLPSTGNRIGDRIGSGLNGTGYGEPNGGYTADLVGEDTYSNREEVRHTTLGAALEWGVLPWLSLGARGGRDRSDGDAASSLTLPTAFTTEVMDERVRSHWGVHATARAGRTRGVHGSLTAGMERLDGERDRRDRVVSQGGEATNRTTVEAASRALFLRGGVQWRGLLLGGSVRRDEPEFVAGDRLSYSVGGEWNVARLLPAPAWLHGVTLRGAHGQTERGLEALTGLPDLQAFCPTGCAPVEPERLTETEYGVDVALFGRVDVGVTRYERETEGVLAVGARLGEVGRVTNRGVEASASLRGPERGAVQWRIDATGAANRNRFHTEEGGFAASGVTRHRDGHPLASYFFQPITRILDDGDGRLGECGFGDGCEIRLGDDPEYAGTPMPERLGSLAGSVRVRDRVTLYVRGDWQSGMDLLDQTSVIRCTQRRNCAGTYDPAAPLDEQAAIVAAWAGSRAGFVRDADFVRLREVALTLAAPGAWTQRLGGAAVELTFAGRNLALWTGYEGIDPETSAGGPSLFAVLDAWDQPPVRTFTTRIDVRF